MIFCQRCKQLNPGDAETCGKCGTKLMLTVRPRSYPPAAQAMERTLEEHLLERISFLEAAVTRANDRFEQLLELARQQATSVFYDHMLVEALTDILGESHALDREELEQRWRTRVARHHEETVERERLDDRCLNITDLYRGPRREEFAARVHDGAALIAAGHLRRGLRVLETAHDMDTGNPELNYLIGEYYFHLSDAAAASVFLDRTISETSDHFGARLLSGLLAADEGQSDVAQEHLTRAVTLEKNSFAAHYGLGRILAREGRIDEALPHFKRALSLRPAPETHFLVGRTYWQLGRTEQAQRHLQKAVRLDPRFDAALYNLGLIYWQSNRTREAREHFRAALEINPRESHYRAAVRAEAGAELPTPPNPGENSLVRRRKARTSDVRFIELLWRDLSSVSPAPAVSRKKS
ncbi:MAG: tetratricopeptide repeat protein [Blastocatellia bacterium]